MADGIRLKAWVCAFGRISCFLTLSTPESYYPADLKYQDIFLYCDKK